MDENRIDLSNWHQFTVKDLFNHFETGKTDGQNLQDGEDCIYLGAKHSDNCVIRHCAFDATLSHKGNCIIFICNGEGSVGYANYIDRPFMASKDLVIGYADWMNRWRGLFVATVLCLERPKYSFGRKWKRYLKDTQIMLPAHDINGKMEPDWGYMDDFIKKIENDTIKSMTKDLIHTY